MLSILFTNCMITDTYYNPEVKDVSQTEVSLDGLKSVLYLIGDAGAPDTTGADKNLNSLAERIKTAPAEKTGVVFLGDNIYTDGMHGKYHPERKADEAKIKAQLDVVLNFGGQVAFIPGNHDWNKGHSDGLKYLKRQEKFIEEYLNDNVFYPSNGCPGPDLIELNNEVVLIIIDTQWWVQKEGKPIGVSSECDVTNDEEFILAIRDMLEDNEQKQIIVLGHHPLHSNSEHGGYFGWQDHIFPLRKVFHNKAAYFPLPGLGSIYPLYRKYVGNIQDIPHERYSALVELLEDEFINFPGLIYASGHDHNLQLSKHDETTHILSGGGSKVTEIRRNKKIIFGASKQGFARVLEYENGDVFTEFICPVEGNPMGEVIFSQKIGTVPPQDPKIFVDETYNHDNTIYPRVANAGYAAGKFKELFLGKQYRDVWTSTINVPVINLDSVDGGVIAIQKGGGMQTLSIRYESENGIQYVSRSINKFPNRLLPKELRTTIVGDIMKDGISSSHPYGFLTIPPMADAVGVYHTNPMVGILPDSPRLGKWREQFAGMLVLFEERPDDNQEFNPSFGNSEKVQSSSKVIEKLREDHDVQVDAKAMLRARLFDMIIADWDRHDDQWRWARFKDGDKTTYKPIPRDRDQVYFKQDGVLPYLASRNWAERRFQSFAPTVRDMRGENLNAQWIDRDYLTSLDLKDWIAIADSMKLELTDEIISEAVHRLPEPAFELTGDFTIETLKARRDNLKDFAEEYYYILAESVDITGSEKKEYFEISYNDSDLRVRMYTRKNGDKDEILFDRIFKDSETEEIRIYGIDGKDEYKITGDASNCNILMRIIGGPSNDKYHLDQNPRKFKKRVLIYEYGENELKEVELSNSKNLYLKLVDDISDHVEYERNEFSYDGYLPLILPGYTPDDGFSIGGGVILTKQGFKSKPYKSLQKMYANITQTGAFFANYNIKAKEVFGEFDFEGDLTTQIPNYRFNFFGIGNEQGPAPGDFRSYQTRVDEVTLSTYIVKSSEYGRLKIQYGPSISYWNPQENPLQEGRFPLTLNENSLSERIFFGGDLKFEYVNTDHRLFPIRGISLKSQLKHSHEISNEQTAFDNSIITQKHEFKIYFPITYIPLKHTFAFRAAFAQNINKNSPFYYLNYIGGIEEMRGFRRNRLAGRSSFYTNVDFRFKLTKFQNNILPMEIGLIAFLDNGRVWAENEVSDRWYTNYGGGVYFFPVNMFLLNVSYGYSKLDGGLVTLKSSFQF